MANYNIGSLITRLRKQKNLTQEELAYSLIDRTTLSKIESGKAVPNNKTLEALLQKLGFNPYKITDFFHDDEMADAQKSINELNSLLTFQTHDPKSQTIARVDTLIGQLDNNKKYTQHEINRQKILIFKAMNAINRREDAQTVRAMLMNAIKTTIPKFNVKNISDYYLTKQDQQVLNMLAICYSDEEQHDKAVEIMYELKHNYDKHCIDNNEMGDCYPAIVYNLSRFLAEADRYHEAIEVCDIGLKVCKETRSLYRLPVILGIKAACLGWIGKIEESKKLFSQIISTLELFEMHDDVIAAKQQAKIALGIDM